MKTLRLATSLAFIVANSHTLSGEAEAACDAQQQIRLSVGGTHIDEWTGTSSAMRAVTLPNGFKLGVKIEETSREQYESFMKRVAAASVPELVRISLYDMTAATPRLMTSTWGGATGKQGYGPKGGADRVDEVGNPGILFNLSKLDCTGVSKPLELTAEMIAQRPTAAMLSQADEKPQPSAGNLRGKEAALADAKSGRYRVVYPDNALTSAELTVVKRELEKAGLQLALESQLGSNDSGYYKGYALAMRDAITEKFGRQKMREIEMDIKKGMSELKVATK